MPSEAVSSRPGASPARAAAPIAAGPGAGVGKGFFSTSSRVQLKAADGPRSRPYRWRLSDSHSRRDRAPAPRAASSGKWTGHCRWISEAVSPLPPSPPLTQRAAHFFCKQPFLSVGYTVHFGCTFFSNRCEFMSKTPPNSLAAPLCLHEGPLG